MLIFQSVFKTIFINGEFHTLPTSRIFSNPAHCKLFKKSSLKCLFTFAASIFTEMKIQNVEPLRWINSDIFKHPSPCVAFVYFTHRKLGSKFQFSRNLGLSKIFYLGLYARLSSYDELEKVVKIQFHGSLTIVHVNVTKHFEFPPFL